MEKHKGYVAIQGEQDEQDRLTPARSVFDGQDKLHLARAVFW